MNSTNDDAVDALDATEENACDTSFPIELVASVDMKNCDDISEAESCDDTDDEEESGSSEDDNDCDDNGDDNEDCEEDSSSGEDTEGNDDEVENLSESSDETSSVGETEKCAICLTRLREQQIGTPESCDHNFCLECITEWAKTVNTCPIDRQVFYLIFARQCLGGAIIQQMTVEDTRPVDSGELLPDNTVCEVCASGSREDSLLLCDGCNLGYHMDCLSPPLSRIPRGDWFCPTCSSIVPSQGEPGEEESGATNLTLRRQGRRCHVVARTIVSEQVRARLANTRRLRRMESDSEEEDESLSATNSQITKLKRTSRGTVKRKGRKTRRKRKTVNGKRTRKGKGKGKKRRKGRKRSKRKSKKARTKTVRTTPKTRLAEVLSLGLPPVGRHMPTVREKASGFVDKMKSDSNAASFSVTGNRMELNYFSDQADEARPVVPGAKRFTDPEEH